MIILLEVTFTNNYNSEALFAYNVAFINASALTCNQNNYIMGVINPLGGSCLNIRNVITTLLDHLNVIECMSMITTAGVKIYGDANLKPYLSLFSYLTAVTLVTNFNFTGNYASYTVFNEIGSAIFIDSIFPLSINRGTFYVDFFF